MDNHEKFIDYITTVVSKKYFDVKYHEDLDGCDPIDDEFTYGEDTIDPFFFHECLSKGPNEFKELGDITELCKGIKKVEYLGRTTEIECHYGRTGYSFSIDGYLEKDIHYGTLWLEFRQVDDYCGADLRQTTISIDNVIRIKSKFEEKYYFLSRKLEDWLKVSGKPKRQEAINSLIK